VEGGFDMNRNNLSLSAVFWVWVMVVTGCGEIAKKPIPNPTPNSTPTTQSTPTETPSPAQAEAPAPTSPPSNSSVEPSPNPAESPRNLAQSAIEVGSVSELEGDTSCRQTGGILVYAETDNYLVYICSDENDPTQPRYYRSFNRDRTPGLNLEATDYDPRQMRYFEFKNGEYTYLLQMPTGATPNPTFTVALPDGSYVEERITRYLAK
jgi:hypothetical protein